MKEKILDFGKILALSKKILLINHIKMDPDAFGSMAAFYNILKKNGYEVKATNDEKVPKGFSFLGENGIVEENLDITKYNPDLIISFDASTLDQLGSSYENHTNIFKEKEFVVIDHHISNPGFGKLNIIDTSASSTCEIVWEIIETIGLEKYVDSHIATLLTTGLLTDTNIYYNTNTTPKTLVTGAKLMEHGANFRLPMKELFKKKQFNKTKLWGEALKGIKREGNIVYGMIDQETFDKTNTTDEDTTGLINAFLANIEGMDICFLLYPTNSGTKASLRSNGYDVSKLCQNFGGGGHKQAAGFTVNDSLENVKDMILEYIKQNKRD